MKIAFKSRPDLVDVQKDVFIFSYTLN